MPNTLASATQPVDTSNMKLLTPPTPSMRPPLNASADPEFNSLMIGPIPPVMGTVADASRQFYRQNVSQLRMSPIQPQASIAVGAQISSHVAAAIEEAGPTFQVNNVPNPDQDVLNITGSGVSYGPGPGEVLITSANDGLTHGTTPWETDSTSVILTDDFTSGSTTLGSIGSLGWGFSGGTGLAFQTGFPPHVGSISWQTSSSANAGGTLYLYNGNQTFQSAMPLLDYPGWKLSWVWRWARKADSFSTSKPASFSECAFYAGLQMSDGFNQGSRPDIFIGAQFDTDALNAGNGTRAIAGSTIKLAAFVNPYTASGRNNALAIPVLQSRASAAGAGSTGVVNGFLPYIVTSSLVVCVSWSGSQTISSVADNLGNTYTLAKTVSNGTTINTAIYFATNLASCTLLPAITVTFSGSTTACVSMYELGGTIILDQTSSGTGSGTSASTGSVEIWIRTRLDQGALVAQRMLASVRGL
jgi:hypothetical protein